MRFFLISDNSDAMNGLRLAGIEGTVARSEADQMCIRDRAYPAPYNLYHLKGATLSCHPSPG